MLRARRRVVLLTVLVAAGTGLLCSLLQPKRYTASAELIVSRPSDRAEFDPQTGVRQDLSREVAEQAEALRSEEVSSQVRELIGAAPGVTATPQPGADAIVVSATASNPADARTVADAYVRAYLDVRRQAAAVRLYAVLDQALQRYADISARLAARPIPPDGTLDAEQRVLLLQQAELRDRIDKAQVTGGARSTGAYSLGPAIGSTTPTTPRPVFAMVLAGLVGGVIGLLAVGVMELLDDTVRGRDDLRALAHRFPAIAEVPHLAHPSGLVDLDAGAPADAFRSMRTALPFVAGAGDPEMVLVTSANASEGKTTIAINLAASLAAAGRRACVVSCDLRRPGVEGALGLPPSDGFTSVVLGSDLGQALVAIEGRGRLFVLPAGPLPPNPAELLQSEAAASAFDQLRAAFDVVVLDSAPILPVTDSAVLSRRADLTILVAAAGRTRRVELERAIDVLDHASGSRGAVVVNHVARDRWLAGSDPLPKK